MFLTITVWRIFIQQTGSERGRDFHPERLASENRNHSCPWNPGRDAPPSRSSDSSELFPLQLKRPQDKGSLSHISRAACGHRPGREPSSGRAAPRGQGWPPTAWSHGRDLSSAKQQLFTCDINDTAGGLRIADHRRQSWMQGCYRIKLRVSKTSTFGREQTSRSPWTVPWRDGADVTFLLFSQIPPSVPFKHVFVCVCMLSHFSHVQLFATTWTVWPTRLLCPWDFPGKNTGAGGHALFQGGSSWPRDGTHSSRGSCIAGGFFTAEPLGKPSACL